MDNRQEDESDDVRPEPLSPLDRQWSTNNISYGAVVPGFGIRSDERNQEQQLHEQQLQQQYPTTSSNNNNNNADVSSSSSYVSISISNDMPRAFSEASSQASLHSIWGNSNSSSTNGNDLLMADCQIPPTAATEGFLRPSTLTNRSASTSRIGLAHNNHSVTATTTQTMNNNNNNNNNHHHHTTTASVPPPLTTTTARAMSSTFPQQQQQQQQQQSPPNNNNNNNNDTTPPHVSFARSKSMNRQLVNQSFFDDAAVSSMIHDAARITNWRTVLAFCNSHPHCAKYAGPGGWTALHHACNRRCPHPDVVEALIHAHPDALLETESEKGMAPLHYACRFKASKEVVRLLLHLYATRGRSVVSRRDRKGRTPLYYAVRYDAPVGVVQMLLEVDPSVVLDEDRNADSPLAVVWDAWAEKFEGKRTLQPFLDPTTTNATTTNVNDQSASSSSSSSTLKQQQQQQLNHALELHEKLRRTPKLLKKWNTVNVFLRAAFGFREDDDDDDDDRNASLTSGMGGGGGDDGDGVDNGKFMTSVVIDNHKVTTANHTKDDSPPTKEDPTPGVQLDCSNNKTHKKSNKKKNNTKKKKKERTWRVLHATAAIKCHPTLFMLSRVLYPEQASELDENDLRSTPLLRAPSSTNNNNTTADAAAHKEDTEIMNATSTHQTALHLAVSSATSGEGGRAIMRALGELFPCAAQVADGIDGSLPLHLIVENERKVHWIHDGVKDVYDMNPSAARIADSLGRLPLHRSAARSRHYTKSTPVEEGSVIMNLLQAYPQAASTPDATGRCVLHYVAEHGEVWDEEAQAILNAHPAATRHRAGPDLFRRLPIHMAAASPDARRSLIEQLVQLHPQGVTQTDQDGKLPLHLACESGKVWDKGVSAIHDAFPMAIRNAEGNNRRWMALHMASASPTAGVDLIENLCNIYPMAACELDTEQKYPLHLACASGKTWKGGLQHIFNANPDAIHHEDSSGMLPFHIAAFRYCVTSTGDAMVDPRHNTNSNIHSSSNEIEGSSSNSTGSSAAAAAGPVTGSATTEEIPITSFPMRSASLPTLPLKRSTSSRRNMNAHHQERVDSVDNDAPKVEIMFELLRQSPDILRMT